MSEVIIIAPHPDDECIGLWEILTDPEIKPIIIYTADVGEPRKEEALKLKEYCDIKVQLYQHSIPTHFLTPDNVFYMPDPIYETNPEHRLQGSIGEQMVRGGLNVIFYSINMNVPYSHEVFNFEEKKKMLNEVYPSQKDLWEYEAKYYLFEARYQWLM